MARPSSSLFRRGEAGLAETSTARQYLESIEALEHRAPLDLALAKLVTMARSDFVALGMSVLVGAGLSLLVACTRGSKEADRHRTIESTSSAPPAASGPIVVSLDALPSEATIFLDDVALGSNPYEAEHPRDARSHVIRFEAAGYEPQSPSVTFSGPVHMHVELVPVRGAAPHPPAARPPATP